MPQDTYTVEEIGARIRKRASNPAAYAPFTDAQIGQRAVERKPELQKLVKIKEPSAVTSTAEKIQQAPSKIKEGLSDPALGMKVGKQAVNALVGAAKGAGSTISSLASLGEKALNKGSEKLFPSLGVKGSDQTTGQRLRETVLKPEGAAQKTGFATEQIAEFFLPVLNSSKVATVAPKIGKVPKLIRGAELLAKGGVEGADIALKTAAQGGSAEDVKSNALFGGAMGAAGRALGMAGKALSPVVQKGAEKTYAQALLPTTQANKKITAKIVPELLKRGVTASTKNRLLSKFSQSVEKAGEAMDTVLEGIPKETPVKTSNIIDSLEKAKDSFRIIGVDGRKVDIDPNAVKHINQFQKILKQVGVEDAPYESVRKFRQILDKNIADANGFYGKTVAEGSLLDAKRETANAIRDQLAKQFPDMDRVNKEYSFWKKAQGVLSDTMTRTQGQRTPLTETISKAGGIAAGAVTKGIPGAILGDIVMGALSKIADSALWKTTTAVQKSRIADYLAAGQLEKALQDITKIVASQRLK